MRRTSMAISKLCMPKPLCALVCFVLTTVFLSGCYLSSPSNIKLLFFHACRTGTASKIESYLIKHPEFVNARDSSGETGLHNAVQADNVVAIDVLVKHKADVNARDAILGATPLWDAVSLGRIRSARHLIAAGADLDDPGGCREPPLKYAVLINNVEMVKLLVDSGADVNWTGNTGNWRDTPLWFAEAAKNKTIVSYLKKHGAVVHLTRSMASRYRTKMQRFSR